VSLKSFDIPQKWFESRVRLLEEVRRRPELPLAMHEAGQAFAYEFNDISLRISSLERTTRIINGELTGCFCRQHRACPCGSNHEI